MAAHAASIALNEPPEDLLDISEQQEHFPNHPMFYIDPATEADLVELLRSRRYQVRQVDELINRI